jgi:hypothetical protein
VAKWRERRGGGRTRSGSGSNSVGVRGGSSGCTRTIVGRGRTGDRLEGGPQVSLRECLGDGGGGGGGGGGRGGGVGGRGRLLRASGARSPSRATGGDENTHCSYTQQTAPFPKHNTQYVDVLREQLQALEGAPDASAAALPGTRTPPAGGGGGPAAAAAAAAARGAAPPPPPPARDRLPPDVLALYRARVRALSEALRPPAVPAFCRGRASALAGSAIAALRVGGGGGAAAGAPIASDTGAEAGPGSKAASAALILQRPAGARRPQPGKGAAATAVAGAAAAEQQQQSQQQSQPPLKLGKEAAARLNTQQALQDGLAEELLGLTAELKAGAVAMQGALRQRGRLVDDAEGLLDASASAARSNARRAGEQYRRSRAGFCQTCLVMVVVALVFAGMIVWIKVTSMVGLGRRKGRGWLW